MQIAAIIALTVILSGLAWMSLKDARDYSAFQRVRESEARIRFFRQWTLVPMGLFGFGGLGLLVVLGRTDVLFALPAEYAAAAQFFTDRPESAPDDLESMLGMAAGLAVGLAISVFIWRARLKKMLRPVGDIEALLPRNGREVAASIPLSINAGISEEIFYRAALPMLAFVAIGSVELAFAISIAAFGVAHWYQGYKGVFATMVMGAIFTILYLSSGSLLKPILLHILIDLVALVIRPAWAIRRALRTSVQMTSGKAGVVR